MRKKGFTYAEILVSMGIMGMLAVILTPIMSGSRPSNEMVMFKKAYYLAEKTVGELINDEDFYPLPEEGEQDLGFGDLSRVQTKNGVRQNNSKFCNLFVDKFNITGNVNCLAATNLPNGNFRSSDGIAWSLPVSAFASDSRVYPIYVDVNGNREPNCFYNANNCTEPDRFVMYFYRDGRMFVDGHAELAYLQSEKLIPANKIEKFLEDAPRGVTINAVNRNALTSGLAK